MTSGLIQNLEYPNYRKNPLGPKHHACYTSNAHLMMVNGGRYGGKDHVCSLRGLRLAHELWAMNRDDPPHEGACVEVAVLGSLQRQADTVWDKMVSQLPDYGGIAHNGLPNVHLREKDGQILLFGGDKHGIKISFLPVVGDGSNLVAPGFDVVISTESAFLTEAAIRDYIKPLVIRPGYAGYLMLNSTPENNWWDHAFFASFFKDDESGRYSNYLDWEGHWFTSFDNPKLTPLQLKDILSERDNNYQRFRRRYLGDLFVDIPRDSASSVDGTGVRRVFESDWIERCLTVVPQKLTAPFQAYFDLAWTERGDCLVIVVLDSNKVVADIEVHRANNDNAQMVRHLERISRDWGNCLIGYDANGRGHHLHPHTQGRGLRIKGVKTDNLIKEKQVKKLQTLLRTGKILIPHPDRYPFTSNRFRQNCTRLRRELQEYVVEFRETAKGGYWFFGKPENGTDDCVDALVGVVNLGLGVGRLNIGSLNIHGV